MSDEIEEQKTENGAQINQPAGFNPIEVISPEEQQKVREKKYFWNGLVVGLLVSVFVLGVAFIGTRIERRLFSEKHSEEVDITSEATLTKLQTLEDSIHSYYYEDVDNSTLVDGLCAGMIDSLGDPYSTYYSPEELQQVMDSTSGIYYGIGAYIGIDPDTDYPFISKVMEGTPAETAGLLADDYIYKVDGTDVKGMELSEVVALVKGEEGTTVDLTIARTGETDYLNITVTRSSIDTPTVTYEMKDDNIAYIAISQFDTVTVDQFSSALAEMKGKGMKSLILDLRGNPGGTLGSVTEIARMMLPEGIIVYTEDKDGNRTDYSCDGSNELKIPIVVLINGNTASAAEILSGAIKDYQMGTLVGTTSFGKGIVQKIYSLYDGSAVKLTNSAYYTPNGNNIHKVGIEPDVTLELDSDAYLQDGSDNQLDKAIEILQGE